MSYLIKDLPYEERPRERFKKFGASALSNEELLSILLRTGTKDKSVKELSIDILKEINIHDLAYANYVTLKKIKGIGDVKAITLLCAIEFSKRVFNKREVINIKTADDIYELVKYDMAYCLQEKFLVVFLDTRNNVIEKKILFVGTVNSSKVSARDVFREAVKCNAVKIILVHNHPAGSAVPSYEDVYMTNEFIKLGKMMDIIVLEHLIIANDKYYSFYESRGDLFASKK